MNARTVFHVDSEKIIGCTGAFGAGVYVDIRLGVYLNGVTFYLDDRVDTETIHDFGRLLVRLGGEVQDLAEIRAKEELK